MTFKVEAPSLLGIGEKHGLSLFQRRYVQCSCGGWDEFWDQVDEGKNSTGVKLTGRANHLRVCVRDSEER